MDVSHVTLLITLNSHFWEACNGHYFCFKLELILLSSALFDLFYEVQWWWYGERFSAKSKKAKLKLKNILKEKYFFFVVNTSKQRDQDAK